MRTYNLFCRKGRAELVCAVPEERPVPAFITGALWEFGGKLKDEDQDPFAFNREAADASVGVNGFYLFLVTRALDVSFSRPQREQNDGTLRPPAALTSARESPLETALARGDDRRPARRAPAELSCAL